MTESIILAMTTSAVTLVVVLMGNSKTRAVTETKLEELTREVREHNNFDLQYRKQLQDEEATENDYKSALNTLGGKHR